MYDDLVKKIRHCATDPMHCLSCGEVKDGQCFKRLMTQAADAIEQLSNAGSAYGRGWTLGYDAGREESKPRWILVTERLPDESEPVLAYVCWIDYTDNEICYGQYIKNGRFRLTHYVDGELIKGYEVKAWMPLLEPPKEG